MPPHNALSRAGLLAVDRVGLNVLGSFYSFRPDKKPLDLHAVANYARITAHRRRTGRGRHERLIYPWPLRYNRHAEFGCQPLVPRTTLDELLSAFEEARRFGGDFCLATHYWEIDDRLAGMLDALIAHADRAGVEWVPADELFAEPSPVARVQPTGEPVIEGPEDERWRKRNARGARSTRWAVGRWRSSRPGAAPSRCRARTSSCSAASR